MDYNNCPDKPRCICGYEMEVVRYTSDFSCDEGQAWHSVECKCPHCGKEAAFWEIFACPRYELLHRYKEGE